VFACTLFVRMRTNSPCLDVRYSYGCGRIAHVYVYAILADTDEALMFACTLVVRNRSNSSSLRVRYSGGCGQIARVCMYAIRAGADE